MSFGQILVEDALRNFALEARSMPWIHAQQEGDRPPRPYGTIDVRAINAIGQGDVKLTGLGIYDIETMREIFEIDVSVQAFGIDAIDAIASLKTWARRPSVVIGTKDTVLLGFLSAGETRDLTQVISAAWEGRAQCDFRFSARFNADRQINTIGTVEISGAGSTQTLTEEP